MHRKSKARYCRPGNKCQSSMKKVQQKRLERKKVAPTDMNKKMLIKKEFHLCIHHQPWTVHKPQECKLDTKTEENQETEVFGNERTSVILFKTSKCTGGNPGNLG